MRKVFLKYPVKLATIDNKFLMLFSIVRSKDPGYIKQLGDLRTQSDAEVCSIPWMLYIKCCLQVLRFRVLDLSQPQKLA